MTESLGLVNLIGLLILGVAWLVTVRLVFARRSSEGDDLMQRGMTIAGWLLLMLGMLGLLTALVGPVAVVVWPVVLLISSMAIGRYRHSERRALLWSMALAAERATPIEQAVRAFADERYDETGLRVARFANELEKGVSLPEAIKNSRNFLPFDAQLACGVGWQAGCLGPALRKVVEFQEEFESHLRAVLEKFLYLALLASVLSGCMFYLLLVVVPRIEMIFVEFDLELPSLTIAVISLSNAFLWLRAQLTVIVIPILGLSVSLTDLIIVASLCFMATVVFYYVGWITWEPLFVRRLWRRVHTAWILRMLAFLVAQRRPMEQNVRLLSSNYPAAYIAQRLYIATGLIASGQPWCDALVARKLIRPSDAAVLRAAERAGNLEWALEEMAQSNLRRLAFRYRALLNVVFPLVILLFGGVMAVVAASLLFPLFTVIRQLAIS